MKISELDYNLDHEKIAIYPPEIRGSTKLLVCTKTGLQDDFYKNLDQYLSAGDLVILNNTKVIAARLICVKNSGKNVEILLTEKHEKGIETDVWTVIYRGKIKCGERLNIENSDDFLTVLEILGGGLAEVKFSQSVEKISQKYGKIPIPPYLNRDQESLDKTRYQTEFAEKKGSVAAPTASLNFTNELVKKLEEKGVEILYLTLHVGLGTFLPVRSDDVKKHVMHSEYFEVSDSVLQKIKNAKIYKKNILAVGTTVVRTLEYIFTNNLQNSSGVLTGNVNIFITPGYNFQAVNMILTNFHAPKSTPLLLVASAVGVQKYHEIYAHALKNNYKFLSYGDSMLIYL